MYKEAEEHINNGLSLLPRILLGSVSGLFGVVLTWFGIHGFINNIGSWPAMFSIGIFCLLIAIANFTWGRVRQFVGSCVGLIIFILACWYLTTQISGGLAISGKRSEPSILNAIFFMVFFGLPSITYTLTAKFGFKKSEDT